MLVEARGVERLRVLRCRATGADEGWRTGWRAHARLIHRTQAEWQRSRNNIRRSGVRGPPDSIPKNATYVYMNICGADESTLYFAGCRAACILRNEAGLAGRKISLPCAPSAGARRGLLAARPAAARAPPAPHRAGGAQPHSGEDTGHAAPRRRPPRAARRGRRLSSARDTRLLRAGAFSGSVPLGILPAPPCGGAAV